MTEFNNNNLTAGRDNVVTINEPYTYKPLNQQTPEELKQSDRAARKTYWSHRWSLILGSAWLMLIFIVGIAVSALFCLSTYQQMIQFNYGYAPDINVAFNFAINFIESAKPDVATLLPIFAGILFFMLTVISPLKGIGFRFFGNDELLREQIGIRRYISKRLIQLKNQ